MTNFKFERYKLNESVYFKKNNDTFGDFSNMSSKYIILVNGNIIRTVEALYQSMKFSNTPEIQREIIMQKSPMAVKYKARKYSKLIRSDWDAIKLSVMEWCLRIKLLQNFDSFSELLLLTGSKHIVELSTNDTYWGAYLKDNEYLIGENNLGKLLMKLRDELKLNHNQIQLQVNPLEVDNFLLFGDSIESCKIGQINKKPQQLDLF